MLLEEIFHLDDKKSTALVSILFSFSVCCIFSFSFSFAVVLLRRSRFMKKRHISLINKSFKYTSLLLHSLLLDRYFYRNTHTHTFSSCSKGIFYCIKKLSSLSFFSSRKGSYLFTYYLIRYIYSERLFVFFFFDIYIYIYTYGCLYKNDTRLLLYACVRERLISTCHFRYDTYC